MKKRKEFISRRDFFENPLMELLRQDCGEFQPQQYLLMMKEV